MRFSFPKYLARRHVIPCVWKALGGSLYVFAYRHNFVTSQLSHVLIASTIWKLWEEQAVCSLRTKHLNELPTLSYMT